MAPGTLRPAGSHRSVDPLLAFRSRKAICRTQLNFDGALLHSRARESRKAARLSAAAVGDFRSSSEGKRRVWSARSGTARVRGRPQLRLDDAERAHLFDLARAVQDRLDLRQQREVHEREAAGHRELGDRVGVVAARRGVELAELAADRIGAFVEADWGAPGSAPARRPRTRRSAVRRRASRTLSRFWSVSELPWPGHLSGLKKPPAFRLRAKRGCSSRDRDACAAMKAAGLRPLSPDQVLCGCLLRG